jgi:putative peptidyl-prolyl cis-trans isomerase
MRLFKRLFFLLLLPGLLNSQEVINDIVAIVGETPITALDLKQEVKNFKATRKPDNRNLESRALDKLINKAIIDSVLKEEVISIPESQVNEIVKKTMNDNGFKDEKAFETVLMQQANLTLADYKQELLNNLKMQQIAQLKINIPTPRETEVKDWYNKHRNELGNKYFIRGIQKAYNPDNPREELAVSKLMGTAREESLVNFQNAVMKYSDNTANAGALGWFRLDELNNVDPTMANIVSRLKQGDVSMVFVSRNNYFLVKVEQITPVSLEDATPIIMQNLYREKQGNAYENWLSEKRKSTSVKVYMKNYQE